MGIDHFFDKPRQVELGADRQALLRMNEDLKRENAQLRGRVSQLENGQEKPPSAEPVTAPIPRAARGRAPGATIAAVADRYMAALRAIGRPATGAEICRHCCLSHTAFRLWWKTNGAKSGIERVEGSGRSVFYQLAPKEPADA